MSVRSADIDHKRQKSRRFSRVEPLAFCSASHQTDDPRILTLKSAAYTVYITSETSPRAYPNVGATGIFRQSAQDFIVNEQLPFEPDGEGEHLLVQVRKTDQNTDWIAKWLARSAGVERRDVGNCGLKDRHAVATQWFSVPATLGEPDLSEPPDGTVLLQQLRHGRKLRPGSHSANHFELVLRDITGADQVEAQLQAVKLGGCPNGFGLQRFGREGGNLQAALEWFGGGKKPKRHQKGHYLSAARSAIFNTVLAKRVSEGTWCTGIEGDVLNLAGSGSVFPFDADDSQIAERLQALDIHITGPLWGKGEALKDITTQEREGAWLGEQELAMAAGLEVNGLRAERRALRMLPQDLQWQWSQDRRELNLSFALPPGQFATAVLHELGDFADASLEQYQQR